LSDLSVDVIPFYLLYSSLRYLRLIVSSIFTFII
jgi:hypothetical protein